MARDLDGSTGVLENLTTPVTGPPFSLACWFMMDATGLAVPLLTLGSSTANNVHRLHIDDSPVELIADSFNSPTYGGARTTPDLTTATWYHGCGVWSATNSRTCYINGGSAVTNTTAVTPINIDRVTIGKYSTLFFSGKVAEAAIWDVALTAADALSLSIGFSPLLVRPENLVFYAPILGNDSPEIDVVGARGLTVTAAVKADHPRIFKPQVIDVGLPVAAAEPTGHPHGRLPLIGVG